MSIKKFESFNQNVIDLFKDCLLDLEDDGFRIEIQKGLSIDAYPKGHFLYDEYFYSQARKVGIFEESSGIVRSKLPNDKSIIYDFFVRVCIIHDVSNLKKLNFYPYVIRVRQLPIYYVDFTSHTEKINIISFENLSAVRKDKYISRICHITNSRLYNCHYSDTILRHNSIIDLTFIIE